MEGIRKLNLGCGHYKKEGYINVDWLRSFHPDRCFDLSRFPYPYKNDFFQLIEADHVLEHLNEPFKVMKELHRILINGGKLLVCVPHFSRGFTHSEHKAGFDVSFSYYFNPDFKPGYQGFEFKLKKMKLTWFAQPHFKKGYLPGLVYYFARTLNIFISFFANLSPLFCSRVWCFWVGGFEEISFEFECVKKDKP